MLTYANSPGLIAANAKAIAEKRAGQAQSDLSAQQAAQQMALEKYLKGSVDENGNYTPGVEQAGQSQQAQNELEQAKSIVNGQEISPGRKVNAKIGNIDISEAQQQVPVMAQMAQQKMQTQQENQYAKGLEKYSDVHGALTDLERITNRDGQGGVLTNPNATLVSSGQVESKLPDSAIGLAEMLHVPGVPQGSAEERKALARVKLSLGHAMTGSRMNPTMQGMIQDSLGGIASGDPQLMTKGLRGAAGIVGSQVNTVQSGFAEPTKDAVHDRLGGDPMDFYNSIVKDAPAGSQPVANSAFNPDTYLKGQ